MTYKYTDFLKVYDDKLSSYPEEYISNEGDEYTYDFFYRDIHLWHRKSSYAEKSSTEIEVHRPFIQMIFSLQSQTTYFNNQNAQLSAVGAQQHNILFIPHSFRVEWEPGEDVEVIGINLIPKFFENYLPAQHPLFESFKEALTSIEGAVLSETNLLTNPRIRAILYEIINIPVEAPFKHLLIEAKIIELLSLQFAAYELLNNNPVLKKLKEEEIEKMYLARDIMMENIKYPCTLINLAQQIGTNENYLKSHFKQVFGTTVHGYLQSAKMEKAREMLVIQEEKVGQVARKLGYKHSSHFTTAFKKHFGFLPTKIKMTMLIYLTEIDPFFMLAV